MSDAELDAALDRASESYRAWGCGSTAAERAALLGRASELYAERRDELAKIISREMGKPVTQALGEVDFSAAIYAYYVENAEKLLADEPVQLAWGEGTAVVRRAPLGILLGIMPWNYPYYQVARFAAPNLMIGNTILLKHAAQCPESSAAIESIFADAGFPAGAYTNLYATYDQIDRVIADPRVVGVAVTGSERVGVIEVRSRQSRGPAAPCRRFGCLGCPGRHPRRCLLQANPPAGHQPGQPGRKGGVLRPVRPPLPGQLGG